MGKDASDLVRIVAWAQDDPKLLARVYLRYPNAKRITVPMVERLLSEELWAARPNWQEEVRQAIERGDQCLI